MSSHPSSVLGVARFGSRPAGRGATAGADQVLGQGGAGWGERDENSVAVAA